MSQEIRTLSDAIDRLLAEHTRLSVENQALTFRLREMEQIVARDSARVKQAKARLDALIAQLPLDAPADIKPASVQENLL